MSLSVSKDIDLDDIPEYGFGHFYGKIVGETSDYEGGWKRIGNQTCNKFLCSTSSLTDGFSLELRWRKIDIICWIVHGSGGPQG